MAKITINPITSGNNLETSINLRLQQIEDSFNDDVLWRNGFTSEPNQMEVDLDMNENDILNLLELTLGSVQVKASIEANQNDIVDLKTALNALWPKGSPSPFPGLNIVWGQIGGNIVNQPDLHSYLVGHDADIAALEAADVVLQANIDAEETSRIAADGALDVRVTQNESDITALEAADVTLQANIDAEESARIAADALKYDKTGGNLSGDITFTQASPKIKPDSDADVVYLLGGTIANPTNGAYVYAEGINYPTAGNGGGLYLSASLTNYIYANVNIDVNAVAPTLDSHLTRKDYVDEKAVNEAIAFAIALGG